MDMMDKMINVSLNHLRYKSQQTQLIALINPSINNPWQIEGWRMNSHDSLKKIKKKTTSKNHKKEILHKKQTPRVENFINENNCVSNE